MKAYIKLLRVNVCILAVLATVVGALISQIFSINEIIIASIVVFLICGAGNVLNDYFDYEIDKINKPKRPLPSKQISLRSALVYSIILFLIGNIIAVLLLNKYMIFLAIINTIIIVLYDYKIKRTTAGHHVDSYIGSSPFLFGGLLANTITFPVLILFLLGFFGNTSREIVKGLEDIEGDKKIGLKTLEIVLGTKVAKIIAIISMIVAISITPLPYLMGYFGLYYIPLILVADVLFIYSLTKLKNPSKSQKLMKMGMFIALFAFLAGLL